MYGGNSPKAQQIYEIKIKMLFGLACTKSWESCRYDIGGS
jgi:hypothetical protein